MSTPSTPCPSDLLNGFQVRELSLIKEEYTHSGYSPVNLLMYIYKRRKTEESPFNRVVRLMTHTPLDDYDRMTHRFNVWTLLQGLPEVVTPFRSLRPDRHKGVPDGILFG